MMHLIPTRTTDELYSRIRVERREWGGGGGYEDFFLIVTSKLTRTLFLTPPSEKVLKYGR